MADTNVTNTYAKRNAAVTPVAAVAVPVNEAALVAVDGLDQRILIQLSNATTNATHTAVIKAGDALQGVNDLEVKLDGSASAAVVVESGRFVNVSGTNKGKIVIKDKSTTGTFLRVAAVVLP